MLKSPKLRNDGGWNRAGEDRSINDIEVDGVKNKCPFLLYIEVEGASSFLSADQLKLNYVEILEAKVNEAKSKFAPHAKNEDYPVVMISRDYHTTHTRRFDHDAVQVPREGIIFEKQ